jgi:hypothetical protein
MLTLRIFIGGKQMLAAPYTNSQAAAVGRLLEEYWPALCTAGRLAVFVQAGSVIHYIGGTR